MTHHVLRLMAQIEGVMIIIMVSSIFAAALERT